MNVSGEDDCGSPTEDICCDLDQQKDSLSSTQSCVSLKSDRSMPLPLNLCDETQSDIKRHIQERSDSPAPSNISLMSDRSMPLPLNLSNEAQSHFKSELSEVSPESRPVQGVCQQHDRALNVFCKTDKMYICNACAVEDHREHSKLYSLTSNVPDTASLLVHSMENMRTEDFKTFKRELNEQYPECLGSEPEELSVANVAKKVVESFGENGALRITFHFLANAKPLQKISEVNKKNLKQKFQHVKEGNSSQDEKGLLNEIYTDLYITEGGSGEINNEHEVLRNELISQSRDTQDTPYACSDIFKTPPGQRKQIRTVLTMGIVGIGKTVSVQKFILDWTDGKSNQNINVIIYLPFGDLNQIEGTYSLLQLIHQYAPEMKEANLSELNVLFILHGLDICQYPLDFQKNTKCSNINQQATVDVLLTNLINGNLFPSALLWITTRPAAASRIPPECVHRVTEIRGFNDLQKEEYFRKKVSDQRQANKIIKHIQSSRSLYIMCHMPIFCWITATVLENMLSDGNVQEIPKTVTEMFTRFLLIQISLKNKKYHRTSVDDPKKLSESDQTMILKLGKLAFQQLERKNFIFYEQDLTNCGIDVNRISEYSVCTVIFREEKKIHNEKSYCFVHVIFQEYLAALFAHFACVNDGKNLMKDESINESRSDLPVVHQSAVDRALESENGHLDIFLRFLLGLSVDTNRTLLQDLSKISSPDPSICKNIIVNYIKEMLKQELSSERIINLFHCLNELNDNSLVKVIQTAMKSGTLLGHELEPEQWSALAYVLLTSGEELDEFDMKKFRTSTANQLRLLPVLKICKKASLDCCNLSPESCRRVTSALQLVNSPLRDLDMSNNKLEQSGVNHLFSGIMSQHCQLQKLRLAGCNFSARSCGVLASALKSTNSPLRELDLSYNEFSDYGMNLLCSGLISPLCKLQKLQLKRCGLTMSCCVNLALVLKSSELRELELKSNDLEDSGVKKLMAGLENPQCRIETLGLSGCMITEVGCRSLASALSLNSGHLRELDLSYNRPGHSGQKVLTAKLEDPNCKLEKLNFQNGGECRMKSGLQKYARHLTVDQDSIHRRLLLSKDRRKISETRVEQQYPDHPDRYKLYPQAMCREALTERCYFEVEYEGGVAVGVAYESLDRTERIMGVKNKFPSLLCLDGKLKLWQNNEITRKFPVFNKSKRVGVYLDWEAGSLSYYSIKSSTLTHLHTIHTTFTDPLYTGFFLLPDSSVTLCRMT